MSRLQFARRDRLTRRLTRAAHDCAECFLVPYRTLKEGKLPRLLAAGRRFENKASVHRALDPPSLVTFFARRNLRDARLSGGQKRRRGAADRPAAASQAPQTSFVVEFWHERRKLRVAAAAVDSIVR